MPYLITDGLTNPNIAVANLRIYHAVALEKMQKRYAQQANCIFRAFIFGRGHLCIAFFPRSARIFTLPGMEVDNGSIATFKTRYDFNETPVVRFV